MNYSTFESVLLINKHFYDTVGRDFDNTRKTAWNTFEDILLTVMAIRPEPYIILDIGCGNGRFVNELNRLKIDNKYIGIDNSDYLLNQAKLRFQNEHTRFMKLDIINNFIDIGKSFNLVVCFGVTHHLPSEEYRYKFFEDIADILEPGGVFVVSFFDFLEDPRFKSKIISQSKVIDILSKISFTAKSKLDLEENDYFLGWGNKNVARYCHYYPLKEKTEIINFLAEKGIKLINKLYSNGKNDKYNSYYIFKNDV